MATKTIKKVGAIKTSWDLSPLFKGDHDPAIDKERKLVEKRSYEFIDKWKKRTDYLTDPAILKEALDEYEEWSRHYGPAGKESFYFELKLALDQNDTNLKARVNKVNDFGNRLMNDIQFFTMRLAKIDEPAQKKFLKDEGLKDYHHFLEGLFGEAKHLLTEDEEKIMTLKAGTSYSNWVQMTSSFLVKEEREIKVAGKPAKKNFAELVSLSSHQDKQVRDQAAAAFNEVVNRYADVAEHELNSILLNKKIDDELRHFKRPDAGRHLSDDIDSEIVDTMINTVAANFDIPAEFYKLKAKLLGVKKLAYHERNVPIGEADKEMTYSESVELAQTVLNKLDTQMGEMFRSFMAKGLVDAYPKKGKTGGAFCAHGIEATPTYILLNFTGRLNDTRTIAHEVGHGINYELMRKQNALNFGSPLSTAEVASTFMEDFVLEELAKEADDKLRLTIMIMKLTDDINSIFRQAACYRFEQELHQAFREAGYLPKEMIGQIFQKHMKSYMGPAVEQSAGSENWWVYWSHIREFFYVYSYASGALISKSLQNQVKANPLFIEKVKEFLSAGSSDSPKNIFKKMGIDIGQKNFWEKGIAEVRQLLVEAEALAKKVRL